MLDAKFFKAKMAGEALITVQDHAIKSPIRDAL